MNEQRWASIVLLLALASCTGEAPPGPILASGRIEGDEVRIAAKISGRVSRLAAREGEMLEAGQVVAELQTRELDAQGRQAEAAVAAAEAALVQSRTRVDVEHHSQTALADYRRAQALLESGVGSPRWRRASRRAGSSPPAPAPLQELPGRWRTRARSRAAS